MDSHTTRSSTPTAEVRRVALNEAERQRLLGPTALIWGQELICGVVAALCAGLGVRLAFSGSWPGALIAFAMSAGAVVFVTVCHVRHRSALRETEKEIVRGVVTRKARVGKRRGIYFLYVGDTESLVDSADWERVRLGDEVELHRTTTRRRAFLVNRCERPLTHPKRHWTTGQHRVPHQR